MERRDYSIGNKRGLTLLDKIQPMILIFSILIGLFIAGYFPKFAVSLGWVISFGIFLVIYSILTGIELKEILLAFKNLKTTLIALIVNFLVVPLYAWLLGYIFLKSYPDIWVGLILYLITPCIGWYLIFTDLAGGNVPLGITLLAWNVILQIALMPVYLRFLAGKIISVDIFQILKSIGIFLILPLLLGRLTRSFFIKIKRQNYFEETFKPFLSWLKFVALIVVIISMFASQGNILTKNPSIVIVMILPGIVYFFSIFILSLILGKIFRLPYGDMALLSFTTTARNSEASVAIAVSAFPANPLVALTVVIGPIIELPILIIFTQILLWIKRYMKRV